MSANIKGLIIVLAFSIPLFAAAKSTALLFTAPADFARRRNIWLILTTAAFLSPNFWIFAAVAGPLLYWGGKKDTNTFGFYLLLFTVVPALSFPIPTVMVNKLFDLNILRLLSLCVLVPCAFRLRKFKELRELQGLKTTDFVLLSFGLVQVLLFVPPDLRNHVLLQNSITNILRTALLFLIDVYALYYVASRSCQDRAKLLDALSAFCLSCCLMATIAIFESVKHWLLYADFAARWGANALLSEYYLRGALVRAQASSGGPLALSSFLVIALGLWLYLRSHVKQATTRFAVEFLFCAGLLVTFSRGPWLAGVVTYFVFLVLDSRGDSNVFRSVLIFGLICGVLLASPLGTQVSDMIPFMGGHVGTNDLTYRELLLQQSWQVIKSHPILGDQLAWMKLQDLRQGEGIIDIVNTYLSIMLFYGAVGLSLFLTFQFAPLARIRRLSKARRDLDPDLARLGASFIAVMIGMTILLFNSSLVSSPECAFYAVVGAACAYPAYFRLDSSRQLPLRTDKLVSTS